MIYGTPGFTGGRCKKLADMPIHFPVDEIRISENLKFVGGRRLVPRLYANRPHPNN